MGKAKSRRVYGTYGVRSILPAAMRPYAVSTAAICSGIVNLTFEDEHFIPPRVERFVLNVRRQLMTLCRQHEHLQTTTRYLRDDRL